MDDNLRQVNELPVSTELMLGVSQAIEAAGVASTFDEATGAIAEHLLAKGYTLDESACLGVALYLRLLALGRFLDGGRLRSFSDWEQPDSGAVN